MHTEREFILAIDTNIYAGSFERPMTAHCTGIIGDCGVGKEERLHFLKDLADTPWVIDGESYFDDLLIQKDDGQGCYRPTSLCITPGWCSDGWGNHYREEEWDDKKVTQIRLDQMKQKNAEWQKIQGRDYYPKAAMKSAHKPRKFPAYQSVAIHFKNEPTHEEFEFIVERALSFKGCGDPKILGFRILCETRTTTTETLLRKLTEL